MFPTFISIIDIQSWWEIPSIAHFCSLFRTAFNLLDFDIEDLEEALLADGTEESSWLQDLIVRLLSGCLQNNDISTFNYQMFLRRLFRQKCQEHDRYNPFNTDIDFQLLPLRTKVDILHALCDFRLDADDVFDQLKNLEADSLRVEPLGYDSNDSAYWYFYGTRLYREDGQSKHNKKSVWQVICFTEDDWYQLTKKLKKSKYKQDKQLYQTLSENFLPELPRLFKEKENLARKRLLENLPRRTSNRLRKLECEAEKELTEKLQRVAEEEKEHQQEQNQQIENKKKELERRRQEAYERRNKLKELSEEDSCFSDHSFERDEMAGYKSRKLKGSQRKMSTSSSTSKDTNTKPLKKNKKQQKELEVISKSSINTTTVGRQTNNSLSAATGQILIQPPPNLNKKRLKTSQVFRQTDEDLQIGMHKILDYVKNHEDAWPFVDPVEEEYAPNYYSIVRKPMDLQRMEERLDSGYYKNFAKFRLDFQLIVDNCRLYNGVENEYTEMVDNLSKVFERATEKYLDLISSSDDEIAIEYSNADSKKTFRDANLEDVSKSSTSRKKPMLAAQTDRKRERSVSEGSENSNGSYRLTDNFDASNNKIEKASKKQKKAFKIKTQKVSKKQKSISKTEKSEKEIKKEKTEKLENKKEKSTHKKSVKSSKTKTKKLLKKSRKRDLVRSRSNSQSPYRSPQRTDESNSPMSWPPSSPDERFDFSCQDNFKNRSRKFNDSEDPIKGKKSKLANFGNDNDVIFSNEDKIVDYPLSLSPKPKDKHNKLRETIEKLKAKSEIKLKDKFEFELDLPKENKNKKMEKELEDKSTFKAQKDKMSNNKTVKSDVYLELESHNTVDSNISDSKAGKVMVKSNTPIPKPSNLDALNIATEQTLKDINKWLDDTPKFSEFSSASNSPSYIGCEELDTGKTDQSAAKKADKALGTKKESGIKDSKKRISRDTSKFFKKREVQRTIDRLQPGKSKGNLIANVQNTNKVDEIYPLGTLSKIKDTKNSLIVKTDTNAPKLSLGSVLDSFGKHKFVDDQKKEEQKILAEIPKENSSFNSTEICRQDKQVDNGNKEEKDEKKENESLIDDGNSAGGATPNLSAWFKAFGAPKVQPIQKKTDFKPDGKENEKMEDISKMSKVPVPIVSPNTDSPVMSQGQPMSRQRKISTGSSMSERSSFSQDMDSPRVGMDERGAYPAPYPSPLHRSPSGASPVMASPRPDISPKATAYPTINGQIRCGFYQDTVSNKSSPEKSCSPKENPQSPYPQYSEHVYTPNTENSYYSYANSPYYTNAPNYSSTNPTPPYNMEGSGSYYDTSKSFTEQYQAKNAQNYTANSPASDNSSPAHPQHSPNLVISPHSPNFHSPHSPNIHSPNIHSPHSPSIHSPHSPSIHSPHSPNIHSPHSPNIHSPHSPNIHSPHSPNIHSPSIHSQHSPNISQQSPSVHSQQSPHSQLSPGIHSQQSPGIHPPAAHPPLSPNMSSHDLPTSPVQSQQTTSVQNSANLQIQNPSVQFSTSQNVQMNLPEGDFQKQDGVIDRGLQPGQSAIFPVKKRIYSDNEVSEITNKKFKAELNSTPRHIPSVSESSQMFPSILDKNYETYHNQNESVNKPVNFERREPLNTRNSISLNSEISSQTPVDINIYSGTKFSNSYAVPFNTETNCSLNIPNTRNISVTQPNSLEMSKYTNMGYTGPDANSTKSTVPLNRTESSSDNSLPVSTSHKSSVASTQVTSSVPLSLSEPMDISRFCTTNTLQRHKTVEENATLSTPQQAHSNYSTPTRTADLQNQNIPCSYKSDVTVPRSSYNSSALDVEQALSLGRNISSFPHRVDRYSSDERLLAGLQGSSTFYSDKGLGTSQLFNKSTSANTPNLPIFNQADIAAVQQCYNQTLQASPSIYNRSIADIPNSSKLQADQKPSIQHQVQEKKKKRKSSKVVPPSTETQQAGTSHQGFQSYAGLKGNSALEPSAISLKTSSVVPGSAFNFGPSPTALGISPGLYSDKDAYPNFLEEFRSAPNYYMAAAAHHRSNSETAGDKQSRSAHQSSNPQTTPGYPFLGAAAQARPTFSLGGPFIPNATQAQLMDTSSPLYQHYLQAGVLNQGLLGPPGAYPPGYHPALSIRQPYDSMSRPSWL